MIKITLLRYKPSIIHFSGHGSTLGEIILHDNRGACHPVPADALEKLFSILQDNIKCIVLNACYSEKQAEAIARHIECVIGMSKSISDLAAISFATAFYQALGYGRDVRSAFELGCLQINLEGLGEEDIPKLLSFRSNPFNIVFASNKICSEYIDIKETSIQKNLSHKPKYLINQDRNFSISITNQMTQFQKTVACLTSDQYRIIEWLRGNRRVRISGCAGSGKTLVAAEKAIRSARTGLRTLILCHNPLLAEYLKKLTEDSGVTVFDFVSWISHLLGRDVEIGGIWSNYYEPLSSEINAAWNMLSKSSRKFDVVIVDEAQDFREEWWNIIELALSSRDNGILYLFHDDNQALLPLRSKYPIEEAPFSLSKNCRNAGNIFKVVRHFHGQAPEVSLFLKNQGIVRYSVFEDAKEKQVIKTAIREALEHFESKDIILLTTENAPLNQSILNDLTIEKKLKWKWQDSLNRYIRIMRNANISGGLNSIKFPKLSNNSFPTLEDIELVTQYAQNLFIGRKGTMEAIIKSINYKWLIGNKGLLLNIKGRINAQNLAAFFCEATWASGIPKPEKFKLSSNRSDSNIISLFNIGTFKGLESNCLILFVRSSQEDLGSHLYVGLSRAKYYLHLIISKSLYVHFQKNAWFRNLIDVSSTDR